jgi:glycerophosphoryl diester phosphodiesterase
MKPTLRLMSGSALAAMLLAMQGGAMAATPSPKPMPLLIAHRGASGELPEHTLGAYALAIDLGADVIEPDLVLTKDAVLVARHENEISGTTDVADRPEFAARRTTKRIDGQDVTGWFTEDFTLAELKTLRARERLPQLRPRNATFDGNETIPTFDEIIALVKAHRDQTGKEVGLYPETKHPSYFTSIGLPHEAPLLRALERANFVRKTDPVFIQSFEVGNLQAMRPKTHLRLIQLVEAEGGPADRPGTRYAEMLTPDGLKAIVLYADGIGAQKDLVIPRTTGGGLGTPAPLVANAHQAGLAVHVWTFRAENHFLPSDLRMGSDPTARGNLASEIRTFVAAGVDGLFSDHVAEARAALGQ